MVITYWSAGGRHVKFVTEIGHTHTHTLTHTVHGTLLPVTNMGEVQIFGDISYAFKVDEQIVFLER
jgi:hypothetical protein